MRGIVRPRGPWRRAVAAALGVLGACQAYPPLPTVEHVDLLRFMGDWYVIAHIPAAAEAAAHNAVESYRLQSDGTIATTYAFRDGGFDAPYVVLRPNGVVRDRVGNATWGMQFFWPLRFEYLITYLDPFYDTTIIARSARDYAWIMARRPDVDEVTYGALVEALRGQGYDTSRLRRVPQRWSAPEYQALERARGPR